MINLPVEFQNKIFGFMDKKLSVVDFESWLYHEKELEKYLSEDEYIALISFSYKQNDPHIDFKLQFLQTREDKSAFLKWKALQIAMSIIIGEIDPNIGCSELGEINRELDWPEELSPFSLLSHEQYDHECIGISADDCVPEIVIECKKFVTTYGQIVVNTIEVGTPVT